ncbi:MAG: TAXI family TRAP transporter solute-binding subunit [Gemmatimonadota bacterium]|jgi:TRAP transporter TAXI family solute receptor
MWIAAALTASVMALGPPQSRRDTLVLLTGSPSGSYIEIGHILARVLEESIPGLTVRVETSGGSVANILSLGRGEADLAIAQSDVASHGARGEAMFESFGPQPVEAIMGLHSEDVLVIARRDLNLPSAAMLDPGRRLVVGEEGSGTRDNAEDVLDALGLGFDAVDTIMRDPRESLSLLATDSADVLFLTGGVTPDYWDEVHAAGAEPLSLGEDLVEVLQRERRYYRATAFEHDGRTVHTVRVRAVLLARSGLSSRRVHDITQALLTNLPEIRASTDLARSILPGTIRDYVPTNWHPGANQYYCEAELGGCTPVVSVFLLAILALLGVGFVALGFSTTLRAGLRRAAPRFAEKLVGPYGMTDRYRYLVIPVLISIIILGGALLIQAAETRYARSNNVTSEFENRSLNDNLLWTLVFTATGYEEDRFPRSPTAKVLSSLLGWIGIGGVILLVGLVTSDQLAKRMKMQMAVDPKELDGHVILCGWNSRASEIIGKLTDPHLGERRQTVVVVADLGSDPVEEHGLPRDFALFLRGTPTDLDHMRRAGLDTADTIIVLADETVSDPDAQTVLTVLQAEKHAYRLVKEGTRVHELRSVAELLDPDKKSALQSVHTDLILCPQEFSEKMLLQALLNPGVTEFIGDILSIGDGNQLVEVPVHGAEDPPLVGKNFDEAMVACRESSVLLLAINRGGAPGAGTDSDETDWGSDRLAEFEDLPTGRLLTNPQDAAERSYRIQPGDSLLLLAHSDRPLAHIFGSPLKWRRAFKG